MGRPILSEQMMLNMESALEDESMTTEGDSKAPLHIRLDPSTSSSGTHPPPSPTWSSASSTSCDLTPEQILPPTSNEALIVRLLGLTGELSSVAQLVLLPELSFSALRRATRFDEVDMVPGTLTLRAWEKSDVIDYVRKTDDEIDEWEVQHDRDSADDLTEMDEDVGPGPSTANADRARVNPGSPCDPGRLAARAQGLATRLGLGQLDLPSLPGADYHRRASRSSNARIPAVPSYQRPLPVSRPAQSSDVVDEAYANLMRSRRTVIGPYHVSNRRRSYDVTSDSDSDDGNVSAGIAQRARRTGGPARNPPPPPPPGRQGAPIRSVSSSSFNMGGRTMIRRPRAELVDTGANELPWNRLQQPRQVSSRPVPSRPVASSFDPNGETFHEDVIENTPRASIDDIDFLDTPPISPFATSPSDSVFPTSGAFHPRTLDIPLSAPPPPRRSTSPLPPHQQVVILEPPVGRRARLGPGWVEAARREERRVPS